MERSTSSFSISIEPQSVTLSHSTFQFRRTLAYWIGVLYVEGACVLIAAAALAIMSGGLLERCAAESILEEYATALVLTPYLIGNIVFTIACYISVVEVLNLADIDASVRMSWCLSSLSQWRAIEDKCTFAIVALNFFGALCYDVNGIASFMELNSAQTMFFVTVPGVVGGISFAAGGYIACHINAVFTNCKVSMVWFLCIVGLAGGMLFFIASFLAAVGVVSPESEWWSFHLPFLVGSVLFGIGGQISLWMWKCEQYGLAFAPGINKDLYATARPEVHSIQDDYGCGRPSSWQVLWLTIYAMNAAASLIDIGIVLAAPRFRNVDGSLCLLNGAINVVLTHGVILLCAVINHVPRAKPYRSLVMYMQMCLLFYTVGSWITVGADVYTISECPPAELRG